MNYSEEFLLFVIKLVSEGVLNAYLVKNTSVYGLSAFLLRMDSIRNLSFMDVYNGVLIYIPFGSDNAMSDNWRSKLNIITIADRQCLEMVIQGMPYNCIPQIPNVPHIKETVYIVYDNGDTSTILFEFTTETSKLLHYLSGIAHWVEILSGCCTDAEMIKVVVKKNRQW